MALRGEAQLTIRIEHVDERMSAMKRKLTITVDEVVYDGLHRVVGRRHISRFMTELARLHVAQDVLGDGCRTTVADEEHERGALERAESPVSDVADL